MTLECRPIPPVTDLFFTPEKVTNAVYMMCSLGADASVRFPNGQRPLHRLAQTPHTDEIAPYTQIQFEILLKFGADPFALDSKGGSPLLWAVANGWGKEFCSACRKSGWSKESLIEHVFNMRKKKKSDAADCTGIDASDLAGPSTTGLSKRVARYGDRLDD